MSNDLKKLLMLVAVFVSGSVAAGLFVGLYMWSQFIGETFKAIGVFGLIFAVFYIMIVVLAFSLVFLSKLLFDRYKRM